MKKRYGVLFIIIVLFLMFYILKDIDFYEVYSLLININLFYFMLAFLSGLGMFLLWNLRFKNSLSGLIEGRYWTLLPFLFSGIFVNSITPGTSIGGEPVRAYLLGKKYNKSAIKVFGRILADKSLNVLTFFAFVIFSLFFLFLFVNIPTSLKITLEIVIGFVFLGIFLIILPFIKKRFKTRWICRPLFKLGIGKKHFKTSEALTEVVDRRANDFFVNFRKVLKDKKKTLTGIGISVVIWILTFLISYFLFLSFEARVSFLSVIVVVTIGYLIGDVIPVPGGIGVVESAMFLLFSSMGIPASLAIVVSLLSRIIYYFYSLVIGSISLLYLKITLK